MSKIVHRVLDFFEAFAKEQRPLSLTEMSKLLDIPPSSCHGVLRAMEERGYLYELKARAGFYPTARLSELGQVIVDHDPVLSRLEPILNRLRDATGESVFLARAKGLSIIYLAILHADKRLRLELKPGDHVRSLYASSAGKAVLASLESAQVQAFLMQTELKALTPHTITSKVKLQRDLKESEARGWFLNREETVEDSLTISGRFSVNGSTYVVTIAGSLKPMDRKLDAAIQSLLRALAELRSIAP